MNNSLRDVIVQLPWPGYEAGEMPGDLSSDLGSVIRFVLKNIPLLFPGCLQSPPTVSEEKKKNNCWITGAGIPWVLVSGIVRFRGSKEVLRINPLSKFSVFMKRKLLARSYDDSGYWPS